MTTLFLFILVLLILVLVHEAGHFFAARMGGVAVDEFGFGFPPRAFGFRHGKTLYSLNWLPLGGFVKLKGEEGQNADDPDSFAYASIGRRAWIIAAGVVMNVILAASLLTVTFTIGVTTVLMDSLDATAVVKTSWVRVDRVLPGTPAMESGIRAGETIRAINGTHVTSILEVQQSIAAHAQKSMEITLENDDHETRVVAVQPVLIPGADRPSIGVELLPLGTIQYPWYIAPWKAIEATFWILVEIVRSLGGLLVQLVVHQTVPADVAGPIGIAVTTGQAARLGFERLLFFVAVLSLNLAVINILPIPALDGGRLLFLVIEAVRRRPVTRALENRIHVIGMVALLTLILLVTYRDLTTFGTTILHAIQQWF